MSQIFIHPGFGKTGTTSIQNHLFGKHPDILSIGRPWTDETLGFCNNLTKNIGFFSKRETLAALDALKLQKHNGPIILSDETIIKSIFRNQIIANRIKDFFPNAKILFTIRNQFTAIPSYYSNHGRMLKRSPTPYNGRHITFDNWFEYSKNRLEESFQGIIPYEPIINLFAEIFGRDSIKILLFEEYIKDLDAFSENISQFLNLDKKSVYNLLENKKSNKRDSSATIKYKVIRERFLPNFHPTKYIPFGSQIRKGLSDFLSNRKDLDVHLSNSQKYYIHTLYKRFNNKLSEEYNLNLKKWNYPL